MGYLKWLRSVLYYIKWDLGLICNLYRSTGRAGLRSLPSRFAVCFIVLVSVLFTATYILLSMGRKPPPSVPPAVGACLVKFFYTREGTWANLTRGLVRHYTRSAKNAEPFGVTTRLSLTNINSVSVTDMGRTLVLTVTKTGTNRRW